MMARALLLGQLAGLTIGMQVLPSARHRDSAKLSVWQYYPGGEQDDLDPIVELCFESVQLHLDYDKFDLLRLADDTVGQWLLDLPEEFFRLPFSAKSEVISAALIAKFGGIFIDANSALRVDVTEIAAQHEACPFYYTKDVVMSHRGNSIAKAWWKTIKEKLQRRCPSSNKKATDTCCRSSNGTLLEVCHVNPQGYIAMPVWEGKGLPTECEPRAGASSNAVSGWMVPPESLGSPRSGKGNLLGLTPTTPTKEFHHGNFSCWFEGADLVCDRMGREVRQTDFLKQDSYRFDPVALGFGSDARMNLLDGNFTNTVLGDLLRNLLLGEDISDVASLQTCYNANSTGSSVSDRRQQLVFIHIPRTGGTTIEDCTRRDPLEKWGCANPDIHGLTKLPAYKGNKAACYKQHVPPTFLPEIYEGKETFCTVRDPYDRMISQFGFANIFYKVDSCSKETLNEYLLKDLTSVKSGLVYKSDCHYVPQANFVYGYDPETFEVDTSDPMCKHILRTENLGVQFNELAATHGYPYTLQKYHSFASSKGCEQLKASDLSKEVRQLIEEVYAVDFELFNYTKFSRRRLLDKNGARSNRTQSEKQQTAHQQDKQPERQQTAHPQSTRRRRS